MVFSDDIDNLKITHPVQTQRLTRNLTVYVAADLFKDMIEDLQGQIKNPKQLTPSGVFV